MKRVIVTGANGFLGSTLTKTLADRGINVVALYKNDCSNIIDSPLVSKVKCSLSSVDEIVTSIPGGEYDAFYHFAWEGVNGKVKSDPITQLDNAKMAINCAIVANEMNIQKLLYAGTIAERAVESLAGIKSLGGGGISMA